MSLTPRLLSLLLVLSLTGCSETLVTDSFRIDDSESSQLAFKVQRFETPEILSLEGEEEYVECLGETITWHGFSEYTIVTKIMPSGLQIDHLKINYDTSSPYWAEGPTSGAWMLANGEDISHTVIKPKGPQMIDHFQANEKYRNQDNDRIHLRASWTGMLDADGNWKVERFVWEWKCN